MEERLIAVVMTFHGQDRVQPFSVLCISCRQVSSDVWKVHCVPGGEPVVLFQRGAVRLLDSILSAPQQPIEEVLAQEEAIRSVSLYFTVPVNPLCYNPNWERVLESAPRDGNFLQLTPNFVVQEQNFNIDGDISNIEITWRPVLCCSLTCCSVLMILLFVFRWSTNIVAESQQFVIFTTEQVTSF